MLPKRKRGVLICVAGSVRSSECIWAAFGGWAEEVNLEVTERLFVSHAEDEGEPKDRKRLLDRLTRCGEDLFAAIGPRRSPSEAGMAILGPSCAGERPQGMR